MKLPSFTLAQARVIAGAGLFALTIGVLAIMVAKPDLANNDLFKSLAQAIVIQGLIASSIAFLFTGKQEGPGE